MCQTGRDPQRSSPQLPPVKRHDENSCSYKRRIINRSARASKASGASNPAYTKGRGAIGPRRTIIVTSSEPGFAPQPIVNVIPDRHRRRACPPMTNAGSGPEEGSGELLPTFSSFDSRRPRTSVLAGLIPSCQACLGLSRIFGPWVMGGLERGGQGGLGCCQRGCTHPSTPLPSSGSLGGERGKASPGDRRWSRGIRERLKEKPDPGPQASPSGLSNQRGL